MVAVGLTHYLFLPPFRGQAWLQAKPLFLYTYTSISEAAHRHAHTRERESHTRGNREVYAPKTIEIDFASSPD